MNFCKNDLYFIILFCFCVFLYWNQCKIKENFQSTTGYQADVEAIRNLSSIAAQLTTNGIVVPGKIVVGNSTDNTSSTISDSKYDANSLCIVGQGTSPNRKITMWDNVQINGSSTIVGNSSINGGKVTIGQSADGTSSTITDSVYDANSLCIVGQGTSPNRKVTLWDNVQINGSSTIGGNTSINGGRVTIGKSADGTSSTITDSVYDPNSLCIVGQGTSPNRKITMWDNVQINGNVKINGRLKIGNWTLSGSEGDGFRLCTGDYNDDKRFWFGTGVKKNM